MNTSRRALITSAAALGSFILLGGRPAVHGAEKPTITVHKEPT